MSGVVDGVGDCIRFADQSGAAVTRSLGALTDASAIADDDEALTQSLARDGYLFFRSVIDRDAVARVRAELVAALQDDGVAAGQMDGRVRAVKDASPHSIDVAALYDRVDCSPLWSSQWLSSHLERILGEQCFWHTKTTLRVVLPNVDVHLVPPHQDGWFYEPFDYFLTAWTPLVEADADIGGLAVAAGSHLRDYRDHIALPSQGDAVERENSTPSTVDLRAAGANQGIPIESVEEEWLSADFHIGDLLLFDAHVVHCSRPNRTPDLVRLSADGRVQPKSRPRGFLATHSYNEIVEAGATREPSVPS